MDEFKLRSIDEFDADFVASYKPVSAPVEAKSAPAKDSLIPQIEKNVVNERTEPVGMPAAPDNAPLYTSQKMSDPYIPNNYVPEEVIEEPKAKKKLSTGALIGKIAAIVLLVVTIVVFLLGCFISVFLDNKGQSLGNCTLNTLSADIDKVGVKKGDLIIAKKLAASEYAAGDIIAVPATGESGCLLVSVQSVMLTGDTATLTVNDLTGVYGTTITYDSSNVLGKTLDNYFPYLGGLMSFAIDNAILVCFLFILLAALWCLVLVLIDKSQSKKARAEFEEENSEPQEFKLNIFDDDDDIQQ